MLHLLAIAAEAGVDLRLAEFNALAARIPQLCKVAPSGRHHMEDIDRAGGIAAVLRTLAGHPGALHPEALTVSGRSLGEVIAPALVTDPEVIRPLDRPYAPTGGLAILFGNLAPGGCGDQSRWRGAGDDAVYRPGAGIRFPRKRRPRPFSLARSNRAMWWSFGTRGRAGGRACRRCCRPPPRSPAAAWASRSRSSPTAVFRAPHRGGAIGHVSPEAAAGGPIALVQTGDRIAIDLPARSLELLVDAAELAARRAGWAPPAPKVRTGFLARYAAMVSSADEGAVLRVPS